MSLPAVSENGICSNCYESAPSRELMGDDEPICRNCHDAILDAAENQREGLRDLQTMQIPEEER